MIRRFLVNFSFKEGKARFGELKVFSDFGLRRRDKFQILSLSSSLHNDF